jgi:hypothetical protein
MIKGLIGIEHQLGQTVMIPQIDEDNTAMVARGMNPAREPDGAPHMFGTQLCARMGSVAMESCSILHKRGF